MKYGLEITQERIDNNPEFLKNETIGNVKIFYELPLVFNRQAGYRFHSTKVQQNADGIYEVVDNALGENQKYGELLPIHLVNKKYITPIVDFTQQEIDAKLEQEKQNIISQQQFRKQEIVQAKMTEQVSEVLNDINLPIAEIFTNKDFYDYWESLPIGAELKTDRIVNTFDDLLYRVIGVGHNKQADWIPAISSGIFVIIEEPGVIHDWQPRPNENLYMIGDKVYWPVGSQTIMESKINNNSWSPTEYPDGWKLV